MLGDDASGRLITAEYRTPFAVQAPLEPQAAVADVRLPTFGEQSVQVWASTQSQNLVRREVAAALDVPVDIVEVTPTYLGGGFGRKLNIEAAVEAARLSKAAGAPVQVAWGRVDAMRNGYFRPPTHSKLYARLDDSGRIQAIEHRQASAEVAFGFFPGFIGDILGADFGSYRGAQIRYDVADRRVVTWLKDLPVRTGWWRGLGLVANIFAIESFVDELAHAASARPASVPPRPPGGRVDGCRSGPPHARRPRSGGGARRLGRALTQRPRARPRRIAGRGHARRQRRRNFAGGRRPDSRPQGHRRHGLWPDRQPGRRACPGRGPPRCGASAPR